MRIPIVNRKGGVAKSTTTINLGAALAQAAEIGIAARGYRTLIIDMDPQASTSFALTLGAEDDGPDLGSVLLEGMHIEEAIRPTTTPNLHLITACEALGDEEELVRLAGVPGFRTRLRDALAMLETPFDVVLFDCPPGIGLPMTLAMIAGDRFIIPSKLERFSLHGTGRLFRFMERLIALRTTSSEPMADIMGVLLTDLNYQFVDAQEREAEIRADYGSAVFETVIRRNVTIERAQDHFRTIFQEDPRLRSPRGEPVRHVRFRLDVKRTPVDGQLDVAAASIEPTLPVRLGHRLQVQLAPREIQINRFGLFRREVMQLGPDRCIQGQHQRRPAHREASLEEPAALSQGVRGGQEDVAASGGNDDTARFVDRHRTGVVQPDELYRRSAQELYKLLRPLFEIGRHRPYELVSPGSAARVRARGSTRLSSALRIPPRTASARR